MESLACKSVKHETEGKGGGAKTSNKSQKCFRIRVDFGQTSVITPPSLCWNIYREFVVENWAEIVDVYFEKIQDKIIRIIKITRQNQPNYP